MNRHGKGARHERRRAARLQPATSTPASTAGHVAADGRWLEAALGNDPLPPLLIVVGLGHADILETIDARSPDTRVIALEPDPLVGRSCSNQPAVRRWRESGRLLYLCGPNFEGADQAWRYFPQAPDAYKLVVRPAAASEGILRALGTVKRIEFGVRANAEARRRFAPVYLTNVLRNMPAMAAGRDVRALAGAFEGVPAVIAAAGPSLDQSIDGLRGIGDRALLVAVDTALRPLLHAGIAPPMVVSADPSPMNARHFQALPDCPDTWLVAESALDPGAAAVFRDRTFWFRLAAHHPWPWLNQIGLDVGRVDMWGSVLTAAFQVACLAGCDPIVIVGADLAYSGGRPYCRGTTYEYDWAAATARGIALEDVWTQSTSRRATVTVPDLRGVETHTTSTLLSFRDWMLAAAKRSGLRVVNASGAGILFGDGIEQGRLLEAVPTAQVIPAIGVLAGIVPNASTPPRVMAGLQEAMTAVEAAGGARGLIEEWLAFAGEGLDRAAIEGALRSALESSSDLGRPAAVQAHVPEQLRTFELAPSLLFQLPEALEQFRRSFAGPTGRTTNVADSERALTLVDALRVLSDISCTAFTTVAAAPASAGVNTVPGSVCFEWPEPLRWKVQIFEALLGAASPTESSNGTKAFVDRGVDPRTAEGDSSSEPSGRVSLALEWLRCAAIDPIPHGSTLDDTLPPRSDIAPALGLTETGATDSDMLRIAAAASGEKAVYELAAPNIELALARKLTGSLRESPDDPYEISAVDKSGHASVEISLTPSRHDPSRASRPLGRSDHATFRVLTDGGAPHVTVAYATHDGVVAVQPQSTQSLKLHADGSIIGHLSWPKPILGELPLGVEGAVAWGDGLAAYPDVESGYVMYRHQPKGEVHIVPLSIRPVTGIWWRGRVFWSCLPRRIDTWTGVASWSPADGLTLDLPGVPPLLGLRSDGDRLRLEPGVPRATEGWTGWARVPGRCAWSWTGDGEPVAVPLAPQGAASSVAAHRRWCATVYPDANLVQLQSTSDERTRWLTAYYPMRAAWLCDSLVLSTGDRELIVFDDLARRVD